MAKPAKKAAKKAVAKKKPAKLKPKKSAKAADLLSTLLSAVF